MYSMVGFFILSEKFMIIAKIINNNIVSSFDDQGTEYIVMGRGLGYKTKAGYEIDESKVEKTFRMTNNKETRQLEELLVDIPMEHVQLCDEIISYAKSVITNKLSKSIYITLTDHINYAITRYKEGVFFPNALKWEIKRFYHKEYLVGLKAIEMINERCQVLMNEDEAASIALHFVNAELGMEIGSTIDVTKMIQNVVKIITYYYQRPIDEESLNYERFMTHLKFFAQRVIGNRNNRGEDDLHKMIKSQYPKAYLCAEKVKTYIENEHNLELPEEEMSYLTVHIKRVME